MANKSKSNFLKQNAANLFGWGILLTIVGIALFAIINGGDNSGNNGETPTVDNAAELLAVKSDDRIKGSATAKITIVEFGDFQCPACSASFPGLQEAYEKYKDKVKFVYRHLPLTGIHPNALTAAYAAEAANLQGKFWEMHDVLFIKQSEWSNELNVKDIFKGYAKNLGMDVAKFEQDMASPIVVQKVNADSANASALKVESTPTFFLNDKNIGNPFSFSNFSVLIEAELARQESAEN